MTTSTLENLVAISRSLGQDSEPWRNIAACSTDDQAWFWTPEGQAGEEEASAEFQQGQLSRRLLSAQDIRQHLDTL